jgi:hypothetical protein
MRAVCKILVNYRDDVEKYCEENDLSVDKVYSSWRSFNDEQVLITHHNPYISGSMLDEHPGTLTLRIRLEDGKLRFMQTEHTRKYLSAHETAELAEAALA